MNGRIVAAAIVVCALAAGIAIYYLQEFGFYHTVTPVPGRDVTLVVRATGQPEPVEYAEFQAIDADSSPIRYRACFATSLDPDRLTGTYVELRHKSPRNAPFWFDCFDAREIGDEIEAGRARTFLSIKNVHYGVDRIVAITSDGRGFAWHDLNGCGERAYDGTVVGEDCPPRPDPTR